MESQVVVDVARLVSLQSTLLVAVAVFLVLGLVVLGWELWGIARTLQGITRTLEEITHTLQQMAQMVAEVLRRVPER